MKAQTGSRDIALLFL